MKSRSALGAVFATTTGITWGGQFVVGKSALHRVDAFPLSTIRYAAAALLLVGLLAAVEGRRALRTDGHGLQLLWLGSLGFAGFNLLAYTGLAHARTYYFRVRAYNGAGYSAYSNTAHARTR